MPRSVNVCRIVEFDVLGICHSFGSLSQFFGSLSQFFYVWGIFVSVLIVCDVSHSFLIFFVVVTVF